MHRQKRWLVWTVPVVAGLVLAFWSYPTGVVILWLALVVVLALTLLEFLDDPAPATGPDDQATRATA